MKCPSQRFTCDDIPYLAINPDHVCQIFSLKYIDKKPIKYYERYWPHKHTDTVLWLVNVQGDLKTTQYTFIEIRTKYSISEM